ncbi:MAG: hypothetical protein PHE24_00005 [Patescibacteria group bacterium]|nr:hypothetical protein [Patescibacteria group bacterium]
MKLAISCFLSLLLFVSIGAAKVDLAQIKAADSVLILKHRAEINSLSAAKRLNNVALAKEATVDSSDRDGDLMPDWWEKIRGLDPGDPKDAFGDSDSDKVVNLFEYRLGSLPNSFMTPASVVVRQGGDLAGAINSAPQGSVIRVEGGRYLVNATLFLFSSKKVMIQGSWDKDFSRYDPVNNPTILDGQNKDAVFYVSIFTDDTNAVILDGLTIVNGRRFCGAVGVFCHSYSVNFFGLMNCAIRNSSNSESSGGVLELLHWDTTKTQVAIVNSIIGGNSAIGIYNQTASSAEANWQVINSTIANNSAGGNAQPGLYCFTLGPAILNIAMTNSIIWEGRQTAIRAEFPLTIRARYSDIGVLDNSFGAIFNGEEKVLFTDPLFVDSTLSLQGKSACIDAGLDVGLRFFGAAPDIGAREYNPSVGLRQDHKTAAISGEFFPFIAGNRLTVKFNVAEPASIASAIYDLRGKKALELFDQPFPAGEYSWGKDVSCLSGGVYFCRVGAQTKKIVFKK